QIDVLKSRRLIRKVVVQQNLHIRYFVSGKIKSAEILEKSSPVKLTMLNSEILQSAQELLLHLDGPQLMVTNRQTGKQYKASFGKPIQLEGIGQVLFESNPQASKDDDEMRVVLVPVESMVNSLQGAIQISPNKDKQSYIVNFSMVGPLKEKSILILNTLIEVYNTDVSSDKTKITKATSTFINSRLQLIGEDLSEADKKVEGFKSSNRLMDVETEAQQNIQNLTEIDKQVLDARTQLQLADYMRESIGDKELQLLPTNIGLRDGSIEVSLSEYNRLVLEREDLLRTATEENPVVKSLTQNIQDIKKNLLQSLDNYRSTLQLSLNSVQQKKNEIQSRLSSAPRQELGFRDIARQQQTIEAIYLFL